MAQTGQLKVGTSGYQYDHWRPVFYPQDLPKTRWFSHYAEHFDAVEINNTFYNLPKADTFDNWHDKAPDGFQYILKYSRYGTHMKRLKDPEEHVPNFIEVAQRLQDHLGPILVQLPPNWNRDVSRLDNFLHALPNHLDWVLEFRNQTWLCEQVFDRLNRNHVALCIHDLLEKHPHEVTSHFAYLRFHGPGPDGAYTRDYPHQALSATADQVAEWLDKGVNVFAFFNNDAAGRAVSNARDFRRYVTDRVA